MKCALTSIGQMNAGCLETLERFVPMNADSCSQLVVVEVPDPASFQAQLSVYSSQAGGWSLILGPVHAVVGKCGITDRKQEGDKKTPIGLYGLGEAFGTKPAPQGAAIPYRIATAADYWVDDPLSDEYNQWVSFEGSPADRWNSYEELVHPLYSHSIIIKYNMSPIVKGDGSALFIHEWESGSKGTLGCIALSYEHLATLVSILDLSRNPHILVTESCEK